MKVTVKIDGEYCHLSTSVEISDMLYRDIAAPVTTGNVMLGDMSEENAEIVLRIRRNAARNIADEVTKMLINALATHDTHNGYRLERGIENERT